MLDGCEDKMSHVREKETPGTWQGKHGANPVSYQAQIVGSPADLSSTGGDFGKPGERDDWSRIDREHESDLVHELEIAAMATWAAFLISPWRNLKALIRLLGSDFVGLRCEPKIVG